MRVCDGCSRHVKATESSCPFCGFGLGTTRANNPAFGLVLGVAISMSVGCADRSAHSGEDDGGGDADTGASTTGATGVTDEGGVTTTASATVTASDGTDGDADATTDPTGASTGCNDPGTSSGGFYATPPDTTWWECDLFGDDCGPGMKCAPVSEPPALGRHFECVPLAQTPRAVGERCVTESHAFSGRDDCEANALCWKVDPDTLEGTCVALCTGCGLHTECEDPAHQCAYGFACTSACDPVDPGCADDEVCMTGEPFPYGSGPPFSCFEDLSPEGGGGPGDQCLTGFECHSGLCIWGNDLVGCAYGNCCAQWCDLTGPNTCTNAAAGEQCVPLFPGGAPMGYEHVGLCGAP